MALQDLEKRIQALEDIEAIKRLKSRYAQVIDGPSPGDIGNLVTETAVFDYGQLGAVKGRRAISEYFKKYPEIRPFRVHYFSQPDITVDGDIASENGTCGFLAQRVTVKPFGRPVMRMRSMRESMESG